jgi:hypothetical protein
MLIEKEGLAGVGAYWAILEEIGRRSGTFRLRIDDKPGFCQMVLSRFTGPRRAEPVQRPDATLGDPPVVAISVFGRTLRMRPARLRRILRTLVTVGLFDRLEWEEGGVLYSRGFERRADEYTRRVQRERGTRQAADKHPETLRTLSGQPQDHAGDCPESSLIEQDKKQNKKIYKSTKTKQEQDLRPDSSFAQHTACETPLSAVAGDNVFHDADIDSLYQDFCDGVRGIQVDWAARHQGAVPWQPEKEHLQSLWKAVLRIAPAGGSRTEEIESGTAIMLDAVRRMFADSTRRKIQSPPAYLLASLMGTRAGTQPWVT